MISIVTDVPDPRIGDVFPCPECGGRSKWVRTETRRQGFVSRRRECTDCGTRFTTRERYEGPRK